MCPPHIWLLGGVWETEGGVIYHAPPCPLLFPAREFFLWRPSWAYFPTENLGHSDQVVACFFYSKTPNFEKTFFLLKQQTTPTRVSNFICKSIFLSSLFQENGFFLENISLSKFSKFSIQTVVSHFRINKFKIAWSFWSTWLLIGAHFVVPMDPPRLPIDLTLLLFLPSFF